MVVQAFGQRLAIAAETVEKVRTVLFGNYGIV
jgi:hypothetical protein